MENLGMFAAKWELCFGHPKCTFGSTKNAKLQWHHSHARLIMMHTPSVRVTCVGELVRTTAVFSHDPTVIATALGVAPHELPSASYNTMPGNLSV